MSWLAGLFNRRALRVLFVGNSLTYQENGGAAVNDVPGLVAALAARRGRRLEAARLCEDGATLADHLEGGRLQAELRRLRWDAVVLQENSEKAGREPEAFRRDALRCAELVRAAGARLVLFEARRGGSKESFVRLAAECGARLAPVESAKEEAESRAPGVALSREDGVHPSPAGSQLAAAVVLESLLGAE